MKGSNTSALTRKGLLSLESNADSFALQKLLLDGVQADFIEMVSLIIIIGTR